MRKIGSKRFCSALVSNGKNGKVVVATDEIRPVIEQSNLATRGRERLVLV